MHQDTLDKATTTRTGEELDTHRLQGYLKSHIKGYSGKLTVSQFPSGYSNLTYLLNAGDKEYVLRRPPFGANIKSAHDMDREYKVLSLLKPIYPKAPLPIAHCEDSNIIGAPFYVMERVTGVILRNKVPKGLSLTPDLLQNISKSTVDNLISLHEIDIAKTGLIDIGKPEGYVQRQVDGWIKRYFNAATDNILWMNETSEWLKGNLPIGEDPSFIHNDYKYDNLVLDPENPQEIIAVLDWEMATVGDPLMDLGTTLAYWIEENDSPALKPFNLTWLPGNLNREEVARRYVEKRNIQLRDVLFYYVFGAFKIGVIAQQIYARYKKGLTKDPRFSTLIHVVNACAENAHKAIKYQRINNFH